MRSRAFKFQLGNNLILDRVTSSVDGLPHKNFHIIVRSKTFPDLYIKKNFKSCHFFIDKENKNKINTIRFALTLPSLCFHYKTSKKDYTKLII